MRTRQQNSLTPQQARLMHYLAGGGHYSVGDIMNALYIGDPRSAIRDLRDKGVQINDKWVPSVHGGRYKRFWIETNADK